MKRSRSFVARGRAWKATGCAPTTRYLTPWALKDSRNSSYSGEVGFATGFEGRERAVGDRRHALLRRQPFVPEGKSLSSASACDTTVAVHGVLAGPALGLASPSLSSLAREEASSPYPRAAP